MDLNQTSRRLIIPDGMIFAGPGGVTDDGDAGPIQLRGREMRDLEKEPLNYRVVAADKKGGEAEMYLYDEIGFWGVTAKRFADDLKGLGEVSKIHLHISSDGGEVFAGRAIYNQLAQHKARIIVHVDGIAASIASLIAMAGNEIRMGEGAFIMIHNAWSIAVGNAKEMRARADVLETIDASITGTYAKRTKNDVAQIKKWMEAETWFSAEDAVAKGFADVVDEPLQVAARLRNSSRFTNIPVALRPKGVAAAEAIAAMRRISTAIAA